MRKGYYGLYQGKVYEFVTWENDEVSLLSKDEAELKNGFHQKRDIFVKRVKETELEWACRIGTGGNYKGYHASILSESDDKYFISISFIYIGGLEDSKKFIKENPEFHMHDRCIYDNEVPKEDVTDVVETKRPLKGFPFPENLDF